MAVPIDERARNWVAKMPAAVSGQHGHAATYHVACVLVQGFAMTKEQAMPLLQEFNSRCLPPWSEHELIHKLEGAEKAPGLKRQDGHIYPRGCLINANGFTPSKTFREHHKIQPPKKVEFQESALSKYAGSLAGTVDLVWLASRSDVDPCVMTSAKFLEHIYRPNEKVLIFTEDWTQGQALWPGDKDLPMTGKNGVWFLAQPVDGSYHPNPRSRDKKSGLPRMSRRSEESVTSWRHFVIESDEANLKRWLAAIVQFPLRIAAIYTSGSRSVHALVKIGARTKGEWDAEKEAMKSVLVTLGADLGAMSAVRLTRLPGCWREGKTIEEEMNGKKVKRYIRFPRPQLQKLLYINPDPPMRPICELALRRDVLKPWLDWASFGIGDSDETNGAALTHALRYYAPVSNECRQALEKIRRELAAQK
jgi:hypothetical protein